mmetsp:Transcript_26844/g.54011  ORF Transcript_26844/g.54011 Transcript_26844/m.54011 type:complete len:233 (-) Transcript_26844:132-830(-)
MSVVPDKSACWYLATWAWSVPKRYKFCKKWFTDATAMCSWLSSNEAAAALACPRRGIGRLCLLLLFTGDGRSPPCLSSPPSLPRSSQPSSSRPPSSSSPSPPPLPPPSSSSSSPQPSSSPRSNKQSCIACVSFSSSRDRSVNASNELISALNWPTAMSSSSSFPTPPPPPPPLPLLALLLLPLTLLRQLASVDPDAADAAAVSAITDLSLLVPPSATAPCFLLSRSLPGPLT